MAACVRPSEPFPLLCDPLQLSQYSSHCTCSWGPVERIPGAHLDPSVNSPSGRPSAALPSVAPSCVFT